MPKEGVFREERLRKDVLELQGLRHGRYHRLALAMTAKRLTARLAEHGGTLQPQSVIFNGQSHANLVVTWPGQHPELPWLLVGAHYDGPPQSPGADDNASGVAVLLEVARALHKVHMRRTVQAVAFTLEENYWPPGPSRIGSRIFVQNARAEGVRYKGALILECVGYASSAEESQRRPALLGVDIPARGDFLAVVSNTSAATIARIFCQAARRAVPQLPLVLHQVRASGRLIPPSRFSDHARFWDHGYPALLLTDTAMFRNPNYHRAGDVAETLNFTFMANIAAAVIAALHDMDGDDSAG
jgi:Zn-dependent M28 family amino/carboxypeptidase